MSKQTHHKKEKEATEKHTEPDAKNVEPELVACRGCGVPRDPDSKRCATCGDKQDLNQ